MTDSNTADFKAIQHTFTQHMRDPENAPAPADIEDRRMAIYRGLLFRNIDSFMANSFPVLRKVHDGAVWRKLIRDYFKNHQAHTPLFPTMPHEFVHYLESERNEENDLPFLYELAHYEWIGMSLKFDGREISFDGIDTDGDLLNGVPVLNPISWIHAYQYPVHKISPKYIPEIPPEQPTYLVAYRDINDKTGFIELNLVSARLLDLITEDNNKSGQELLEQIAKEMQHSNPELVIQGGLEIIQQMLSKSVLLGVKS